MLFPTIFNKSIKKINLWFSYNKIYGYIGVFGIFFVADEKIDTKTCSI